MSDSTKYEPLKLENQLCFPLYVCAKETIRLYNPYLEELGLTYTQYITMLVLWEHEAVSVKQLGEYLYLDSGTLTPLLKKLEMRGLISRCRCKHDERSLIVSLTEEGRALRDAALSVPEQMKQCVNLSREETITLYRLLYKLLDSPKRTEASKGARTNKMK